MEETRNYNIGESNYHTKKYQPWDFWIKFGLNPFDADIVKRILRTKKTDPRVLDYKKIKHICLERIRQFENNENVFSIKNLKPKEITLEEMIKDYDLMSEDVMMLTKILYPKVDNRLFDYACVIELCDIRIKELEK